MDPRDLPRLLPGGASCTACGATVPAMRIRLLAERDDVAFVELVCDDCGSAALGLVTDGHHDGIPVLDVASDPPVDASSGGGRPRPISATDVEMIRRDLAGWRGDLVSWLAAVDPDRIDQGDRA